LNIKHLSPALLGEKVQITATVKTLSGNKINCDFQVVVGSRIIAEGEQGQAILKKEKVEQIIQRLK
jgi:predicted thioesterase